MIRFFSILIALLSLVSIRSVQSATLPPLPPAHSQPPAADSIQPQTAANTAAAGGAQVKTQIVYQPCLPDFTLISYTASNTITKEVRTIFSARVHDEARFWKITLTNGVLIVRTTDAMNEPMHDHIRIDVGPEWRHVATEITEFPPAEAK